MASDADEGRSRALDQARTANSNREVSNVTMDVRVSQCWTKGNSGSLWKDQESGSGGGSQVEVALFSTGPLFRSDGIEGSRRGAEQPSYPSGDRQR